MKWLQWTVHYRLSHCHRHHHSPLYYWWITSSLSFYFSRSLSLFKLTIWIMANKKERGEGEGKHSIQMWQLGAITPSVCPHCLIWELVSVAAIFGSSTMIESLKLLAKRLYELCRRRRRAFIAAKGALFCVSARGQFVLPAFSGHCRTVLGFVHFAPHQWTSLSAVGVTICFFIFSFSNIFPFFPFLLFFPIGDHLRGPGQEPWNVSSVADAWGYVQVIFFWLL